jgi:putative transposase
MAKYDQDKHHRRSIRLKDYDYRQPGWYFVTICTHLQECLFGQIRDNQLELNTLGCIVDTCWNQISVHFPHVVLDTFVVMPNHLHGILGVMENLDMAASIRARHVVPLQENLLASESFAKPISGSLATVIRSFKAATTRQINRLRATEGEKLWQRNYYEEIVFNESELDRIRYYISTNPERWLSQPST